MTANGGVIPTETFISQQQKAIERRNWYQMIDMTICYNQVIRYIILLSHIPNFPCECPSECNFEQIRINR